MGLSIEEQREKIRAKNYKLGTTEKAFTSITKNQVHQDIKNKRKLRWNNKQANKLMNDQRELRNVNELKFRAILKEFEIPHVWQQPFYCHNRYVCVDFYFESVNLVVEIDGYFHGSKKNLKKDTNRTKYLKLVHKVKDILRVTNKQLETDSYNIKDLLIDKLYI